MIRPDYNVGDEVVYVGLSARVPGGAHFCLEIVPDDGGCDFHGMACAYPAAAISNDGSVHRLGFRWCAGAWRKAPTGKEQSTLTTSRKAKDRVEA